ncbi:CGNR zinc finger domain-containing protein [Nonomuraea typhae]|uniref:CGNR zinc finger domain-containing protein n=1 Tax=Nonomuraea typhae TaxID=2603600 RepID=UPI001FE65D52|nr:ABATE domain-containing protein [Nonomuraea typhae]
MEIASTMVLTGGDGQRFRFDAGTLCLEFLLTGAVEPWELLHEPGDLTAWIPRSRLGVQGPVEVGEAEFLGAKRLRGAVLRLALDAARSPGNEEKVVAARAAGIDESTAAPYATLNEFAAAPPPIPVIGDDRSRGWAAPVTGSQFLSAVARDAIELFAGDRLDRVRMCGGERCWLLFLDVSRPGARRWCSMDRCGNRQKLRARRKIMK